MGDNKKRVSCKNTHMTVIPKNVISRLSASPAPGPITKLFYGGPHDGKSERAATPIKQTVNTPVFGSKKKYLYSLAGYDGCIAVYEHTSVE